MIEDRIVTTAELRRQRAMGLGAELLLPAGVLEDLEDPGFHILVPKGRVMGPDTDKMLGHLILDGTEERLEVDVNVEDWYFDSLPTPFQVLVNLRQLLPDLPLADLVPTPTSTDEPF
jgi:hypothetical protein